MRPVEFSRADLEAVLQRFAGAQTQVPPMHSALKVDGQPLYRLARAGQEVPREPRHIVVHAIECTDWQPPVAVVTVDCSKGTYVRVLAEDIGEALGCGAHLIGLRRTATGGFGLDGAVTLAELEAMDEPARERLLRPAAELVAEMPRIDLDLRRRSQLCARAGHRGGCARRRRIRRLLR